MLTFTIFLRENLETLRCYIESMAWIYKERE